jgi:hypothetical protein
VASILEGGSIATLPYHLTLSLLGASILVRCKYSACAEGIAAHFSPAVCEPWTTPDIIVDCDWESAGRYLFRARNHVIAEPLTGVRVHCPGSPGSSDWPYTSPPIPPLVLEPFCNRFIGLHGAAAVAPEGSCLLLLGERESGKTTVALDLVNEHGWELLTDETVFIHRRSRLVEPFAHAVGLWDSRIKVATKAAVPAVEACRAIASQPALVTHVVCLEHMGGQTHPGLTPITSSQAFRTFLNHHLDAGCRADEAMVSLVQLARAVPAAVFAHGGYADLRRAVPDLIAFACATQQAGHGPTAG